MNEKLRIIAEEIDICANWAKRYENNLSVWLSRIAQHIYEEIKDVEND